MIPNDKETPLGPLPDGWRAVQLRDITTKIGSGATPTGGEKSYLPTRHRYALVRSQNVFDRYFDDTGIAFIDDGQAAKLRGVEIHEGDVLLNITGDGVTFARACLAPRHVLPACVNQHVSIIRPNPDRCIPGYVLSYLTHPQTKRYIESFNAGGSRRAITKGHIESFVVPLPPLPEQQAIARILSTLDDKIELNRRMNETLEAMARALFKSWFVDFDPVRAKAEGRQPAGMDAETAALFPDAFEESELGEIPRGWTVARLGEVVSLEYGKALKEEVRRPGTIPVMGSNGQVGWHDRALVAGPGIVVGRKGNPGTVTWVPTDFFPIDTTFFVQPREHLHCMRFWYHALTALDLGHFGSDSAVPGLNRNIAYMTQVLVPPPHTMVLFERYTTAFVERAFSNDTESRTLVAIRDALLPRLLSGELRVKEVEKVVEEVIA
jgi:type I restriction enzyme S subunit